MDSLQASRISGGNPAGKRHKSDFYPTPWEATAALLDYLHWMQIPQGCTVWEPACGNGDMSKVIRDYGYSVIETDIQTGVDFLSCEPRKCDWIITNPPFSLAEQFIRRAYSLGIPFAFLLKSQYWNAQKRESLFRDCQPSHILPCAWRVDFTGGGNPLMDVMWVIWRRDQSGTTFFRPLSKPKRTVMLHGKND